MKYALLLCLISCVGAVALIVHGLFHEALSIIDLGVYLLSVRMLKRIEDEYSRLQIIRDLLNREPYRRYLDETGKKIS